jgi:hypothetical protein
LKKILSLPDREGLAGDLAILQCSTKNRNMIVDINSPRELSVPGEDSVPSATAVPKYSSILSLDQLQCWIDGAQQSIVFAMWRVICGGGNEKIRKALFKVRDKMFYYYFYYFLLLY